MVAASKGRLPVSEMIDLISRVRTLSLRATDEDMSRIPLDVWQLGAPYIIEAITLTNASITSAVAM